jgi:hypothetical protein
MYTLISIGTPPPSPVPLARTSATTTPCFSENDPGSNPESAAKRLLQLGQPRTYPGMAMKDPGVRRISEIVHLHVPGEGREPRLVVASVEGIETSPEDLHVVLQHRLLPQPGGFERFALLGEPLLPNCGRIAERPDHEDRPIHVDAAAPSASVQPSDDDDLGPRRR